MLHSDKFEGQGKHRRGQTRAQRGQFTGGDVARITGQFEDFSGAFPAPYFEDFSGAFPAPYGDPRDRAARKYYRRVVEDDARQKLNATRQPA